MASPGIWRNGCQKWREAVFHHRSNSKYYTYIIPWVFHIMPYMLQSFAEYARNLISRKKKKNCWIHNFISPPKFLWMCKSLHDFLCACFYGIKGRDHTMKKFQLRSFTCTTTHESFSGVQFSCYHSTQFNIWWKRRRRRSPLL